MKNSISTFRAAGFYLLSLSLTIPVALLLLLSNVHAQTWQVEPLRTKAQQSGNYFGGEGMQLVWEMEYAPSDPNIVYLITDSNQVWKSTDGGATWLPKHKGFLAWGGNSIAIHPTNPNLIFASAGGMSIYHPAGEEKGVYRSTDGGENWTKVKVLTYVREHLKGDRVSFTFDGSVIYAGSDTEGLWKSTDSGTTWVSVKDGAGATISNGVKITDVRPHPSDAQILFICNSNGLYKVTDSGASATIVQRAAGLLPNKPFMSVIDKNTPNTMYAAITLGAGHGVYKSTDAGVTFTVKNGGLSTAIGGGMRLTNISISPADPNYLFVCFYNYIYYTQDGAATNWISPTSQDEQNVDGWVCNSLHQNTNAGNVFNSWDGGRAAFHPTDKNTALVWGWPEIIKKTINGGEVIKYAGTSTGVGQTGNYAYDIDWDKNNPNRYCRFSIDYGSFLTEDGGSTFKNLQVPKYNNQQTTGAGAIDYTPGSQIAVTASGEYNSQYLIVSRNIGTTTPTWSQIGVSPADYREAIIDFHQTNNNIVYAGNYRFNTIQSNNNYTTLSRVVRAVYPGNNDIVYAKAISGNTTIIYKSTNQGGTWTTPYPSVPTNWTGRIAVAPNNQDRLYIAGETSGVFIIDGGSLTTKNTSHGLVNNRFGTLNITHVAVDPLNSSVIYAGAGYKQEGQNNGVFRSIDSGNTWTDITGNLGPEFTAIALSVNPHNSNVYVGSHLGTWRWSGLDAGTGTPGQAPTVLTGTATAVTSTSATLNASINPNGSSTTVRFQYGTSPGSYTTNTGSQTVSSGTSSVNVSQAISGLVGSTTYYVRAQANSANGSTNGSETTFSTTNLLSYSANNAGTNTITVDGVVSEWPALTIPINKIIDGVPLAVGTGSIQWTPTDLYFAIQVSDSILYSNGTSTPYLHDGADIYISRDGSVGNYNQYTRQFSFIYGSSTFIWVNAGGTNTGCVFSGSNTANTWVKEGKIPASNFVGGSAFTAGSVIGFDFQINDNNGTPSVRLGATGASNPANTNYFQTDYFGIITLAGTTTEGGGTETTNTRLDNIASSSLKLWSKLDEGTGTATFDSSGNCPNGSITAASWAYSPFNLLQSLDLDGTDDHVRFGTPTALNISGANQQISLSVRIRPDQAGGAARKTIISKYNSTTKSRQFALYQDGGNWQFTLSSDGSSDTGVSYNPGIATGTSYHLVATYDVVNMKLFQNNVQVGTTSYNTGIFAGTASVALGAVNLESTPAQLFNGVIDDSRIYNTAISVAQINDLYTIASVVTGSATSITQSGLVLNGSITPNGSSSTQGYFQYGTVTAVYTGTSTYITLGTGSTALALSRTLTGLASNTEYFYRAVSWNGANNIYGSATSATTSGVDSTAPVGTATINSSGTYTTAIEVTLNLSATDAVGVTGYFLSGSTTVPYGTQTGWVAVGTTTVYSSNIPYTLGVGDGTRTVYVWYKDAAGNISNSASDSIVLDTTFTGIAITSPSSLYTMADGSKAFGTTAASVVITGSSTDTNGVTSVVWANSGTSTTGTATGTTDFSQTATIVASVVNTFSFTARDTPGNQGDDTISIGSFPAVATDYATAITRDSATLVGTCSANNNSTNVWFDYGVSSGYYTGSSTTGTVTGAVDTSIAISLGALASNTTIYYRAVATNAVDTVYGSEFSFDTLSGITTNGQFNRMDLSFPGSTKFNVYMKSLGIYPGLFWARNYGTAEQEALKTDPDAVLSNYLYP